MTCLDVKTLVIWTSKVWSFGLKSLVIWTSKVWSFGHQKFGHLEVKSLVIWTSKTSKVTSFWLRKFGREDVRILALNVLNTSSTPKFDVDGHCTGNYWRPHDDLGRPLVSRDRLNNARASFNVTPDQGLNINQKLKQKKTFCTLGTQIWVRIVKIVRLWKFADFWMVE